MKLDKKNLALAGTTGGTVALGTLYGVSQNKQEEQKDEAKVEVREIIKDSPETLAQLQRLESANKELLDSYEKAEQSRKQLSLSVTGLEGEKKDLQANINKLNQDVKNLQDELTLERNWTNQLEGWRENDIEEKKSLKEALKDALDRLIDKDSSVEALEESIRSLEGTIDSLDEENSRLNDLLYELEDNNDVLRDQLRLWVHAYNVKDSQMNSYLDTLVKMLGQQRKGNPLFEEVGCWYSRTSDSDVNASYGLNCPKKIVIGQDNKEYGTLTVAWAKKSDHPNLWEYFKKRYEVYGGGTITEIKE